MGLYTYININKVISSYRQTYKGSQSRLEVCVGIAGSEARGFDLIYIVLPMEGGVTFHRQMLFFSPVRLFGGASVTLFYSPFLSAPQYVSHYYLPAPCKKGQPLYGWAEI